MLVPILIRLAMAASGTAPLLAHRVEISSPVDSLHRIREGLFLIKSGKSPYEGWSYHGAPLLLPLFKYTSHDDFGCALPFIGVDLLAAWILRKTQKILSLGQDVDLAEIYLLCPFTILSCVGCSIGSLSNLFVLAAVYSALSRMACLCALTLACAVYISLYPALLTIPLMLVACRGAEGRISARHGAWRDIGVFCLTLALGSGSLAFLSSSFLANFREHQVDEMLPSARDLKTFLKEENSIDALSGRKSFHWMLEAYGFLIKVDDLTPNMGLWWYFFSEMIPFYRPLFRYVFHSMNFIFTFPICLKFRESPLLIIILQTVITAMLKPYPTVSDYALIFVLLWFRPERLERVKWWSLFVSAVLLIAFEPSMYYQWVHSEAANANFYYSINLFIALWLILLLYCLINSNPRSIKEKDE